MTWLEWLGAGGVSVPLMLLLLYAARRTKGVLEVYLKVFLEVRSEREQRATMVAMAQALPEGGSVARFEEGQPAWLFHEHAEPGKRALAAREAV
ncbi:hypothetical protein E6W17_39420 [Streptomyces sp. A1547]|nr:hypothetical protein E6W17_39420 [Streptomyces sp. A1547]